MSQEPAEFGVEGGAHSCCHLPWNGVHAGSVAAVRLSETSRALARAMRVVVPTSRRSGEQCEPSSSAALAQHCGEQQSVQVLRLNPNRMIRSPASPIRMIRVDHRWQRATGRKRVR
jgi:hypothetical protein